MYFSRKFTLSVEKNKYRSILVFYTIKKKSSITLSGPSPIMRTRINFKSIYYYHFFFIFHFFYYYDYYVQLFNCWINSHSIPVFFSFSASQPATTMCSPFRQYCRRSIYIYFFFRIFTVYSHYSLFFFFTLKIFSLQK